MTTKSKSTTQDSFLTALGAPARRALEGRGITTLTKLARHTEAEILQLHGVGPSSLPRLRSALSARGLAFRPAKK